MDSAPELESILVTGSSGLLGKEIVSDLSDDYRVVGLDVAEPEGSEVSGERFHFVHCDLTDEGSVQRALGRVRESHGPRLAAVIHLAAYYDFSGKPSDLYDRLTVQGTRRLLRYLQSFDVARLIFSSTLLVMKPAEIGDVLTEDSPLQGEWDYPISKIATEKLLQAERGKIPVTVLRLAGAYDEEGHSPPITQQMARIYERRLESYFFPGNAEHYQPFVHIEDAVAAIRCAVDKRSEVDDYAVYLIAEPSAPSYSELQETLGRLIHGKKWPAIPMPPALAKAGAWMVDKISREEKFIKPWMIDLADAHYPASVDKAARELGWVPTHQLAPTLPLMVEHLKEDPKRFYAMNKLGEPNH